MSEGNPLSTGLCSTCKHFDKLDGNKDSKQYHCVIAAISCERYEKENEK